MAQADDMLIVYFWILTSFKALYMHVFPTAIEYMKFMRLAFRLFSDHFHRDHDIVWQGQISSQLLAL